MRRRDVLKLLSLSALALAASPVLAACGDDDPAPGPGDVEGLDLVVADVDRTPGDPDALPAAVASIHATGARLHGRLGEQPGNLAVSPYSVAVALAMTANGARGATLDELRTIYGGAGLDAVNDGLNALTQQVESLAGDVEKSDGTRTQLELDAANGLFGQQGTTWQRPFLETLAASYGAGVQAVDWKGDTEGARRAVNRWTAEQTRDKIPEIVGDGAVSADTRLVLVNTLYLKAPWDDPFDVDDTEDRPFTLLDATEVDVPLMRGLGNGRAFARGDGWTAARLDYAGGEVAMTVVLPDAGRFADVEADLVARGAGAFVEALEEGGTIDVSLPRWTFRYRASLTDALKAMGVMTPFDREAADFTAMTTDEPLHVGDVVHEVYVAVDEEGTEAAAATAVLMEAGSAPAEPLELVADRPFLFVVHDVEHGTPLFLGRVVDPRG